MSVLEYIRNFLRKHYNVIIVSHPYDFINKNVTGFRVVNGSHLKNIKGVIKTLQLSISKFGYDIQYNKDLKIGYVYPSGSEIDLPEGYTIL